MKLKLFEEFFKWGLLSLIALMALPDLAFAASDVKSLVTDVTKNQVSILPYALSAVCYVGGSFMLVSGALALKKHAENPSSTPMSQGIARIVTGGAITAVPALTGVIQTSTGLSGSKATFTAFDPGF